MSTPNYQLAQIYRKRNVALMTAGGPNTFLGSLAFEHRDKLIKSGRVRWYDDGDTIYRAGNPALAVMAVVQGRVSLESELATGSPFVGICYAGHLLGDSEPLSDHPKPRRYTARALDDAEILVVPLADFMRLLAEEPGMWQALYRDSRARLDTADFWIAQLAGGNSAQRLARILLYYADQGDLRASRPAGVRLTSRKLASWIGVNKRTVERHLADWDQDGFVGHRKNSGVVWVLNGGDELKRIAKPEAASAIPPVERAAALRKRPA